MKRKILLPFIFFLFFIACNEDQLSKTKNEDMQGQSASEDIKDQNIVARAAVSGAVLTMGIDSPLDASGNVVINSGGTTRVNFRVLIVRNSASSDVHLQFQIMSRQKAFWTSELIRTIDFAAGQLQKTITGSFDATAVGVGQGAYDICLFVKDYIANGETSTSECKNTVINMVPIPGIAEIEPDWIFDAGTCAFREVECYPRSFTVYLGTGEDIPGASIYWSGGESHITWNLGSDPPEFGESIRFITKSGVTFPITFTVTARVTKPGYTDVIRTRTLTLHNCCFIED